MDRQCCPGGKGGSPDVLAKSLVIPAIYTKFKLKFVSDTDTQIHIIRALGNRFFREDCYIKIVPAHSRLFNDSDF